MDGSICTAAISPRRQRLIDDMNMRRFSRETQHNYIRDVWRFATFLGRSSDTATADDMRRFQFEHRDAGMPTRRDRDAGLEDSTAVEPLPGRRPGPDVRMTWHTHCHLLFNNWINMVYQGTLYDLSRLEPEEGGDLASVGCEERSDAGDRRRAEHQRCAASRCTTLPTASPDAACLRGTYPSHFRRYTRCRAA